MQILDFAKADTEEIRALIFEDIPSLSTPRQLTRYLCGLTSPTFFVSTPSFREGGVGPWISRRQLCF